MPVLPTSPSAPTSSLAAWFESALAAASTPAGDLPALVFVGLGDGDALGLVADRCPRAKVLALEPDPAVAARCAAHPLAAEWITAGRLTYLVGPSYTGSDRAWRVFPDRFEAPPVLVHPQLALTPAVAKATEVLKAILFGAEANARARKRFAPQYLLNSLRNLPGIVAGRDVRALAGAFPGVPAVIVAAGPSLDRNLPELAALRDRALIIATDTAARPLLSAGVTPHLIIGLDPGEVNGRHLLALPGAEQSWLVAESALDPRATAEFGDRTFWFRVGPHQPWPWFNELGLDVGRLDVWGSVLTGAFNLAVLAGCGPIVLIGADLSFPGRRPYARGTTYEFDWAWAAARGTALEQTWETAMQRELIEEGGVHGRPVPTTPSMRSFRDWLLARARSGEHRIVNATGDGILVGPGIEQLPLDAVLRAAVTLPDLGRLGTPRREIDTTALAEQVRHLGSAITDGTDSPTLTAFINFTLGTLDRAPIAAALSDAARRFDSGAAAIQPSDVVQPAREAAVVGDALAHMPETLLRLRRTLLRGVGHPEPDPEQEAEQEPKQEQEQDHHAPDEASRVQLMTRALALLRTVVEPGDPARTPVEVPAHLRPGTAPIGALATWPEQVRWVVLQIEALLGAAAGHTPGHTRGMTSATVPLIPRGTRPGARPATTAGGTSSGGADPRLVLACEWASIAAQLTSSAPRAHALVSALVDGSVTTTSTDGDTRSLTLRLEAGAPTAGNVDGAMALDIVLPLSPDTHARLLTGTLIGDERVPFATLCVGRAATPSVVDAATATSVDLLPQRLSSGAQSEFMIGAPTEHGVVVAATLTHDTCLVTSEGLIEPHLSWPRPVTGVLPGQDGSITAWSSASAPARGVRPYLMYRASDEAQVDVIDLPFRPGAGCWMNGTLYFACLADGDTPGGLGCWRPGGEPARVLPERALIGVVRRGDELVLLERPMATGARQPVRREWRWTPGSAPIPHDVRDGDAIAHEASTADGRWTAATHADRHAISLTGPDGRRVLMTCVLPYRVAWCGDSLLVTTLERQLLRFADLRQALETLE